MSIRCTLNGDGTLKLEEEIRLTLPGPLPELRVPAGTVSDGQSAPRGLWWLTGPPIGGPYDRAWLGHDILCESAETWADRTVADGLLMYWLRTMGASRWKAYGTYLACLTYGRFSVLRRSGW